MKTQNMVNMDTAPYYRIVSGRDEFSLAVDVNHLIEQGWQPVGGIAAYSNFLYQAMLYVNMDDITNKVLK